jgi:hypothetical protein
MRATRSDDTLLDGAFVPDRYVARVVPPGFAGADLYILAVFGWGEPTFANVYIGIAGAGGRASLGMIGTRPLTTTQSATTSTLLFHFSVSEIHKPSSKPPGFFSIRG